MRCFDRFQKDPRYKNWTLRFSGTPVFECSDVSKYYFQTPQNEWSYKDFPTLLPPYPACWFDFSKPAFIQTPHEVLAWGRDKPDQWGLDCRWYNASIEFLESNAQKLPHLWKDHLSQMKTWISNTRWIFETHLFWYRHGQCDGPLWVWRIFLDAHGDPFYYDIDHKKSATVEGPTHSSIVKLIDTFADKRGISQEESRDIIYSSFVQFLHTGCLSVSFLHCKNIELTDVVPPRPKPLTHAQRRRGEELYRPITYKVLSIAPMRRHLKEIEQKTGTTGSKTLHYVRGHFHYYEQEKPMFGNPENVGRFFIPLHTRGSLEKGITVKDYKMKIE